MKDLQELLAEEKRTRRSITLKMWFDMRDAFKEEHGYKPDAPGDWDHIIECFNCLSAGFDPDTWSMAEVFEAFKELGDATAED